MDYIVTADYADGTKYADKLSDISETIDVLIELEADPEINQETIRFKVYNEEGEEV